MSSNQQADYQITTPQQELPDGRFPLTLCITRDEVEALLTALNAYSSVFDRPDAAHIQAVHESLRYAMTPEQSPCAPCSDPETQCVSFYPQHPRFQFSPGTINGTSEPPAGYAQHPWFTGNNYVIPGFQLLPTDVIGDGNSFRPSSLDGFIQQITQSGFPRFRFHWEGPATIELHFIGVPFSGIAVTRVDDGAAVDLIDIPSLSEVRFDFSLALILAFIEGVTEGNFIPTLVHEIKVDAPGSHYVDVLMVPNIEPIPPWLSWGGGIRKIVVCGTEVSCEDQICPECPECPDCEDDDCGGCGCDDDTSDDCADCGCDDCDEQTVPEPESDLMLGSIILYPKATPPSDAWVLCDGATYARANYPAFWDNFPQFRISTVAFRVPDLRQKFALGYDPAGNPIDSTGGESSHTLTADEMPSHTHVQDAHNHTQNAHNHVQDAHNHVQDAHNHTQNAHNHTQNAHAHVISAVTNGTAGTSGSLMRGGGTIGNVNAQGTAATNQDATATNQAATATNQAATATNQAATATNQAATATNQPAGGGDAHNNMPPYNVLPYFIRIK